MSVAWTIAPMTDDAIPNLGSISLTGNRDGVVYAAKASPTEPTELLNTAAGRAMDGDSAFELPLGILNDMPELCRSAASTCRKKDITRQGKEKNGYFCHDKRVT